MPHRRPYPHEFESAYHEAAHAVAAHSVGWRVVQLYITPGTLAEVRALSATGAKIGQCICAPPHDSAPLTSEQQRNQLLDEFFWTVAPGPAVDRLYEQRNHIQRYFTTQDGDFASDLIDLVTKYRLHEQQDSDISLMIKMAQERARHFVTIDANWRAIQQVANAVLLECVIRDKPALNGRPAVALIKHELR